ncbi:hypothetical protein LWI29_012524 [Acer saccharum]|uniref:Uncharacterized protein n=1 Tax=Acer saccharum TaxID=4024 RepID=A0AA39VMF5_ACESA|nr:hypothetical protein LWI29_012524 [Acer saccharum]
MTCRVPRYFCTPKWNHLTSAFPDEELKTLARAAVRPLEKRGKPYLYNEGKMIKARLFPQISARRRRRNSFVALFEEDVVCDALARRMKGIMEASRKAALRQRDARIAPSEEESDESAPENPPEGDDEGESPIIPEETQGHGTSACSAEAVGDPEDFGVSRTSPTKAIEQVHLPRGKRSSGGFASAEPNLSASEIPIPADPISTPGAGNVEAGQPGKRKASFSSGRPYPKIPRVVAYVDSSSGDEGEGDVEKEAGMVPPEEQIRDNAGGSTNLPGQPHLLDSLKLVGETAVPFGGFVTAVYTAELNPRNKSIRSETAFQIGGHPTANSNGGLFGGQAADHDRRSPTEVKTKEMPSASP